MEKLYTSKTLLKMASGWMCTLGPHPTLLDLSLAMSYRNHRKSPAYFRYFAPSVLFFFTKAQNQKGGGGMAQCPPKYAPA